MTSAATKQLPLNVIYYGSTEPLPERRLLRAGPLSLVFEAGDLRYIRLGEREVLRRVYVAVRDRDWATVPSRISGLQVEAGRDWFTVGYQCEHQQGDVDFAWRAAISGDAEGTIRFSMEGEARSTFLRSRIGFCVLHPIRECAGKRCVVETLGRGRIDGTFPTFISPRQPFTDMQAIAHEAAPGLWANVRFSGDIFEMEDQRNWIDASYKTYCTPLRLPWPVEITRGTKVSQSVTVQLNGPSEGTRVAAGSQPLSIALGAASDTRLPRIGLGTASHGQAVAEAEAERLGALNLAHLRVDLDLARDYQPALRRAAADAARLAVPLQIAIFLSENPDEELSGLRAACESLAVNVCAWLVFPRRQHATDERSLKAARRHLGNYTTHATFAGGTNAHFADFGRARLPLSLMDAACYSITPQAHASDNASIAENAAAITSTIETARALTTGLPLTIGPVTLRPRFNANVTCMEPDPVPGEFPSQVDPRQLSLFAAGWTLTSLKYIAETGGVDGVTYYETTGWRGVMETAAGSPAPDRFPSRPASVFPLYHVLADVGELTGAVVIPTRSNDPLTVDALGLKHQRGTRMLIANLTDAAQAVTIRGLPHKVAELRRLDETCAEQASMAPEAFRAAAAELLTVTDDELTIELLPYAFVRIDARS